MPSRDESVGVFAGLAAAFDWYDNSLQTILASRGLKVVSRTQAIMLIHINSGTDRPSEIAREMRTTRQNIHAMAKSLIDDNLIVLIPDSSDKRAKRYRQSDDAMELRDKIKEILDYLNSELSDRIGKKTVNDLRRGLAADWGDIIAEAPPRIAK